MYLPLISAFAVRQLLLAIALADLNIELAGSKSRGMILVILLTEETHFRCCYKPNLAFDTCQGTFESFKAIDKGFQYKK